MGRHEVGGPKYMASRRFKALIAGAACVAFIRAHHRCELLRAERTEPAVSEQVDSHGSAAETVQIEVGLFDQRAALLRVRYRQRFNHPCSIRLHERNPPGLLLW